MKAPIESSRRDRPALKSNVRRVKWRHSIKLLGRDVRRHPALAILLCGYVAIFATGWWFYLAAPQPIDELVAPVTDSLVIDGDAGQAGETEMPLARRRVLQPPQAGAFFGTDRHGVGVLTRVLRGAAETLGGFGRIDFGGRDWLHGGNVRPLAVRCARLRDPDLVGQRNNVYSRFCPGLVVGRSA